MADTDYAITAPDDEEEKKPQPSILPMPAPAIPAVAAQAPPMEAPSITNPQPQAQPIPATGGAVAAGPQNKDYAREYQAQSGMSPIQQQNPFAVLMAKEEAIHNPFLRVLSKVATGIGAGAEGLSKDYPEIEKERASEAAAPGEAAAKQAATAHEQAATAAIPSENDLRAAQIGHENAETNALKNPIPKMVELSGAGGPNGEMLFRDETGRTPGAFTLGPNGYTPVAGAAAGQPAAPVAGPQAAGGAAPGVVTRQATPPNAAEAAKLAKVGDDAQTYNSQIADIPGVKAADFQVKPTDTKEDAEKKLADARAEGNIERETKSAERVAAAPAAEEERKEAHNYGYSTDHEGNVIYTTEAKAAQSGQVFEPVNATAVHNDGQALSLMGNVQLNASNYRKALNALPGNVNAEAMQKILSDPKLDDSTLLKMVSLGNVGPQIAQGERATAWNELSRPEQNAVTEYLRAKGSVIAYQRALTNQGRTNPEALQVEFDTIPVPYVGATVANPRFDSFQENIDQVSSRLPSNLPGIQSPKDVRAKVEGNSQGGGETKTYGGFSYTKGSDGLWHKGKAAQ